MQSIVTSVKKIVMKLIAMATPSCDVITHKISESFDRQLSLWDRVRIRLHVWSCVFCERYRRQLIMINDFLQKISEEDLSDVHLSAEKKERIKESMKH
ncbi:MAG TPA: hypothetical protein ENK44_00355 [Caldithrix abyssi]|uniref:Zf-HC2 domain-containing protein n=1 Tax=Caldithrix abyssi TaxID=187145 RepID=A0A7V4UBP4_CALAY|nr:hypothetical protein [Caldithrix abyssi]